MANNNLILEKENLSEAKGLLLNKRLQGKRKRLSGEGLIQKRPPGDTPLSYTQERLWFVYGLNPGSSAYNIPLLLKFEGTLDIGILQKSFSEIIYRHESLRTNFKEINGQPFQIISDQPIFSFSHKDVQHFDEALKNSEVKRIIQTEVDKPFDLTKDLLLRACLIKLNEDEHLLILNIQHIIFDGWSIDIFFKELSLLYEAYKTGIELSLPSLRIQYADYAVWQRNWLKGSGYRKLLDYWKTQLADAPSAIGLPTDHPRPNIQTYTGKTLSLKLPGSLYNKLSAFSGNEGVTLYITLLAAFKLFLYRYSGQEDFTVGTFIAARNRIEIENLIGFFANTLVMRTDISGNPTFRELLKRVREISLNAHSHQDMPFERLVAEIQPQRNLSYNPLFQVMFDLQNEQVANIENLRISSLPVHHNASKFDLSLVFDELSEGLIANIEYNTDLFDEITIDRMLIHLQNLLEEIVLMPDAKISDYKLVSGSQKEISFLNGINNTTKTYPDEELIHTLFEQQAKKTPDNIAFIIKERTISYKELNERANQLAYYIIDLGIKPESQIGIYIERSIEMIVAMLAVMKAGAAYVPFDPAYPKNRILFMLNDTNAEVLLTEKKLSEDLPDHNSKIVLLDSVLEKISMNSKENPSLKISSENVFNVIYTSGSTARPKGVLAMHKSALNRFNWMWERFPFTKSEICCQKTALSFVDSIWEIFGPLLKGITSIIIPDDMLKDPNLLITELAKRQVTRIVLVPSLLNSIMDSIENLKDKLPKLKYWFTSGEALTKELALKFEESMPDGLLINLYGSSEVAADVTYYEIKNSKALPCIPIGKPISNTQVYILDKHLNPLPVGVVGELYIGGENLAKGYLNQPELTSEKFIKNPFELNNGKRLYKTGDLARFWTDGNIEYKGRVDQQVKIRGYRIELQEIEAVLKENKHVKDCIIDVKEYSGDKRLVGYVIPEISILNSTEAKIAEISDEFSSQWKTVWEDTYQQSNTNDKTFNTIGWNSSYTGKAIPENEMRNWLSSTVDRILSLKPKRMLEIGAGTGMLLFRIASGCEKYVGTDISPQAINYLRELLKSPKYSFPQVELLERSADNFTGIEKNSFDTVIINSVVQYFPSIEYLYKVLENCVNAVSPGGTIFLGDIRSFPLLKTFHTSVQLSHAPPSILIEELKIRIEKNIENEKELVIDPTFFKDIKASLPKIGYAEVQPKRGNNCNEITTYRYDAFIYLKKDIESEDGIKLDWKKQNLNLEKIEKILSENKPASLGIINIPNERIVRDAKALELIVDSDEIKNAGELTTILRNKNFDFSIDPEKFWNLENKLPYKANVSWLNAAHDGSFDVIFEIKDLLKRENKNGLKSKNLDNQVLNKMKPLDQYSNNPIHHEIEKVLIPQMKSHLQEKLPEFMIPSSYVFLNDFPLTSSGKVNRRALPLPEQRISLKENKYIEPKDELELKLASIWEKILDIKPIGTRDNFFELGGHSLMAVKLFFQIEKEFNKRLPLATLYQAQTIEELAKLIRGEGWKSLWSSLVPIQTNGSRSPLFIVHGGGGNVLFCKDLINFLPTEQPLYGLQSVGLDRSTPPLTTVEEMAAYYVKEVQLVQPKGPYYLAGNCFGGLITFEMARKFNELGERVALLILIESYNPGFSKLLPSKLKQGIDDFKMGGFESIFKKIIWKTSYQVFKLLNKPLPPILRSVVRANHKAFDQYRPKFYEDKITLFVASRSPAWSLPKPLFGWEELTNHELEVHKIPGGHLNIFEKHNIAGLAENLSACLEKSIFEEKSAEN